MPHIIVVSCSKEDTALLSPHATVIEKALREATVSVLWELRPEQIVFTIVPFSEHSDDVARFQILAVTSYWEGERREKPRLWRNALAEAWSNLAHTLRANGGMQSLFESYIEIMPFKPGGKWGLFKTGGLVGE